MERKETINPIRIGSDIWFGEENAERPRKLSLYPHRLIGGVFALVTEGSANIIINIGDYEVSKGVFIIIAPESIVQIVRKSNDFSAFYIAFSPDFLARTFLKQSMSPFFTSINQSPVLMPDENPKSILLPDYIALLRKAYEQEKENSPSMALRSLAVSLMYELNSIYESRRNDMETSRISRKSALYRQLISLIVKHYNKERSIAFYAGALCLTPKYLSAAILEVSGRRVSDLICKAVIMDAKSQLKSSNLTVSQISESLNFPDASLFCKYFRKHTGMTPAEYRRS